MQLEILKSKIHRACVTDANIEYEGSITIDKKLADSAGIVENEKVQVVDLDNGARVWTYVIMGKPGSKEMIINGAAAHLIKKGDRIIVMSFCGLTPEEYTGFKPYKIVLNENNEIIKKV